MTIGGKFGEIFYNVNKPWYHKKIYIKGTFSSKEENVVFALRIASNYK